MSKVSEQIEEIQENLTKMKAAQDAEKLIREADHNAMTSALMRVCDMIEGLAASNDRTVSTLETSCGVISKLADRLDNIERPCKPGGKIEKPILFQWVRWTDGRWYPALKECGKEPHYGIPGQNVLIHWTDIVEEGPYIRKEDSK